MVKLIMQSLVYYVTTSIPRVIYYVTTSIPRVTDSSIVLVPTTLRNSHNNFCHAT